MIQETEDGEVRLVDLLQEPRFLRFVQLIIVFKDMQLSIFFQFLIGFLIGHLFRGTEPFAAVPSSFLLQLILLAAVFCFLFLFFYFLFFQAKTR